MKILRPRGWKQIAIETIIYMLLLAMQVWDYVVSLSIINLILAIFVGVVFLYFVVPAIYRQIRLRTTVAEQLSREARERLRENSNNNNHKHP